MKLNELLGYFTLVMLVGLFLAGPIGAFVFGLGFPFFFPVMLLWALFYGFWRRWVAWCDRLSDRALSAEQV